MKLLEKFDSKLVQPSHILAAATSDPDYEMNRTIVLESIRVGKDYFDYVVLSGCHCSCFGFDDVDWNSAIGYTDAEFKRLVRGWAKSGYGSEGILAPILLRHFGEEMPREEENE